MASRTPVLLVRKTLLLASAITLAAGALTGLSLIAASPAGAVALLPAGTNVVGTCTAPGAGGSQYTGTQPISAAVAATSSGGTVYICPGTWLDNVTVSVPMTIEGASQASTIVEPFYSSPNGYGDIPSGPSEFDSTVFFVQADSVTIQGLTINGDSPSAVTTGTIPGSNPPATWTTGASCDTTFAAYGEDGGCDGATFNAGAAIDTGNVSPGITGMTVQDVTIENVYNVGISDRSYDGTFDFRNNTITNVGGYGSDGIFTYESNGTISNNSVAWAGAGIQSNWGALSVTGNTVENSNWGVFMGNIGEPAGYADGGSTTISGNTVSSCWGQSFFAGSSGDSELGIALFAPFAPTAETVSGNTVTGCSTGLADFSSNNDEPNTYATPVVTFSSNTVNGQGAYDGIGALVSTDKLGYNDGPVDAQFIGNTISNFPTALYTDETNLSNWAGTNDSALPGGLTVSASGNQFDGAWFNDATGTITATNNWWGLATGPTVTIGSPDSESPSALISRAAPTWWNTPNGLPSAPQAVSATRGNRSVLVRWSAPTYTGNTDPSVTITGYTATATPSGKTCSTAGLSCVVSGLTNGTSYSFTVRASSESGHGQVSSPASATPSTTPTAPRSVSASPGNESVTVSWSAPSSNGGAAITSYTATSSPGGKTCSSATTSCTVSGLTNGTSYTFTVTATNVAGTGPASAPSAARVPAIIFTISPFKYDSSKLTSSMKSTIRSIASLIKEDGIPTVSLVGYTNPGEAGSTAKGQRLGLNRAIAVASFLVKELKSDDANTGVVLSESYGGTMRISTSAAPPNRRVVVSLT